MRTIKYDKKKYNLHIIDTDIYTAILTDEKEEKRANNLIKTFVALNMLKNKGVENYGCYLDVHKASETAELVREVPILTYETAKKLWKDFIKMQYEILFESDKK